MIIFENVKIQNSKLKLNIEGFVTLFLFLNFHRKLPSFSLASILYHLNVHIYYPEL